MRASHFHPTAHLRRDYDTAGEFGVMTSLDAGFVNTWVERSMAEDRRWIEPWSETRRRWYRFCRWIVSLG